LILFYGRGDDPPLQTAVEAARELEQDLIWLDQCGLDRADLLVSVTEHGATGVLTLDGRSVELDAISGIYARPLDIPRSHADTLARARSETFHELFLEWLELAPTLVVNRPSDMDSNGSKPYQAQLIGAAGFDVPETLVTSSPEEARAFWRDHERVIFKSISGVRSIVTELDESQAARLDRLRDLPVQLQQMVSGEDVRVHVIGKQVFACAITSEATDYRYAHYHGNAADLSPIDLPVDVSDRCLLLSQQLQLPFCGIDLRRSPSGQWVCFEVNPMPAYTYFERETGLPISRALITLLATGTRKS